MSSFFTGTFRGLSDTVNYHKVAIQRAIGYLIERYLGAFTSISQKQLDWSVSWSKQEFVVKNIDLKPKAVNDVLDDFPCKVVEGYVGRMSATIPWLELSTIPTDIHLKEVDITLRPKAPTSKAAQLLEAMSESMIHSMDASIRFAEETVTRETKGGRAEGYKDTSERNNAVSWMAGQLERIKNMVHFVAEDITVRIEIVEDQKVVGMEIRIDRLEFFDDQVVKAREGLGVDADVGSMIAWLIKNIQMKGISIYLDHQPMPFFSGTMPDSTGTSPPDLYLSALEETMEDKSSLDPDHEKEESEPPRATPLHIATVAGRADVKLQMKSKESVEGPKVFRDVLVQCAGYLTYMNITAQFTKDDYNYDIDVSIHFGAFHSLLSPKQVESLTKILSCYATPPEPDFESKKAGALNWHMGPEDYARVGQVLERDMRSGRFEDVTEPFSEDCNYLANGDPMFHTMEPIPTTGAADMNLSVSSLDSASTLSTIPTLALSESEQRQQEKSARKVRESAARAANEPSTDRSHYQLTVATVSVCLLHEELQEQGDLEWVNSVQALAAAYFQGLRHVSTAGQVLSLKQLRDRISEVVPKDHLGLLCKPLTVNMSERTVRSTETFQVDMNIHQTELVECLFGSTPQSCFHEAPVKVPQYCEILTFSNELNVADPGGASLPLSLDSLSPAIQVGVRINSRTGPYGYTYKETKVKVDLGNLMTEVDITIQDRLSTLLTTLTGLGTSPYASSQPLVDRDQQFHQAMEDVMQSNNALDLDLSCHHATARIRFPIPDLRPPNQHAPREWWGRNLHKESLLLEIEQLSLLKYSSPEAPSSTPFGVEVMCNKLDVYFQEDFNKTPRLFGSIVQGTGDVGDNFNRPRVVIKSFPPVGSSLMDTQEEVDMEQSSGGLGSLDENDPMFTRPGSTPFSLRREIVHGSRAFEEDDRAGFNSMFERVAPGNKEEMLNFMDMATSNTALLVDITAPKVLLTIHEKQVLELLYNRINNDLLLWQPQSPSSPETFASGQSLNIQPQYLNPDLMTSCSDSNDSDSVEDFTSASQLPRRRSPSFCHPSDICLSINIGEGKVFACVQMKEEEGKVSEGLHGELALLVKDASMFVSVGHEGNKDLRYVTIGANRAQLYHAGRVKNSRPPVSMEHLDTLTFDSKGCFGHMQSRIIRSEPSVPVEPLKDVGTGESSEDMVAVAIRIKVDNWNNNKYFLVAAAIRGATLRHEKHWSGEGWIQQVMELVDLTDYPIEGYVMPEVLTDLNIGLMGCAVDYRPKDFSIKSLRSLLTVQKFSLAVNINTSTKYTTMKFLFDEVNLWLSEKAGTEVNVDRDYLRIGHVGLLEVGLRLGQAFHQGSKTLVWFGNNKIEFKFCSDSCAAFINLLDHYINDRDLAKPQDPALALAEELPSVNLDERTEAQNLHVEQSIAEALEEHFTPSASPDDSPVKGGGRPLYFSPQGVEQISGLSAAADGVVLPELSSDLNVSVDEDEEEEEFTIINDFGMGLTSKDASEDNVFINEDEDVLSQLENCCKSEANILAEDLKTPTGWPVPEFKCVLRELNLDICIHDGNDFGSNTASSQEKRKEEKTLWTTSKDAKKKVTDRKTGDWPWRGGVNRNCDVMVRMVMYKFRLRYEIYDESEERSRRLVAVWRKVEIEDHLEVSPYNKFLYWPDHSISNEGTNMLCLKVNWERPDARYNTEEVSIRLMMQSIKLHVNQDTQRFIQKFFTNVAEAMSPDDLPAVQRDPSPSPSSTPRRKKSLSAERAPIFSTEGGEPKQDQTSIVDDSLMHFGESPSGARAKCRPERPPRIDVEPEDNPVFFKSFVMSHDVTVTVDYTGTGAGISASNIKTMASTAIQGVLRIESVPITLKAIELQRGYKGLGKLVEAILMEWQHNIITKQLPSVVGGIGPISIVKTIIQGILDFFRLPLEQYRKDGRVWRGFQKGALSLKTATQTALLDLLKKVIESVMVCSSVCFDILSSSKHPNRIRDLKKTPKDLREGMSGAVTVVKEGISGTLQDLIRDASQQKEQKGLPGAMGYIIKNMPATVCAMPVQVLSAGADQCVTGIRHEIRPDLLKETQEKYKDMN